MYVPVCVSVHVWISLFMYNITVGLCVCICVDIYIAFCTRVYKLYVLCMWMLKRYASVYICIWTEYIYVCVQQLELSNACSLQLHTHTGLDIKLVTFAPSMEVYDSASHSQPLVRLTRPIQTAVFFLFFFLSFF